MTEKCYRSELIGLFGFPVDENPTVVIMEAAFKALELNYRYNTMLVYPEDLETAVKSLKALHMKGTHITIPHKVSVIPYLDRLTDTADLIGAVNTVYEDHGQMIGENTDGKGFIKSLEDEQIKITGKKSSHSWRRRRRQSDCCGTCSGRSSKNHHCQSLPGQR